MRIALLCAAITLALLTAAYGQDSTWKDPGYDTTYIQSFRDDFVVTLVSASTTNDLSVYDKKGTPITFSTNLPTSFGVGIDYKWITAEYTSSFGRTGPAEKGYTKMSNVGFGLTTRKFWFRNFYQQTEGFYLKNPTYFDPQFDPATENYPFRNDVRSSVYYATLNYGFNSRKFSNIAAIWQLERQKKSAGSFTVGMTYSLAYYHSDSALFEKKFNNYFNKDEALTDFNFRLVGLNAGYLHTFAFTKSRKFFVSLTLIPGLSLQQGKSDAQSNRDQIRKQTFGAHAEGRVVAGYNGDRWYMSLTAIAYTVSSAFEDTNPFAQGYSFGRFALGYKIKMPETKSPFLKKLGL